jgi:hypothetical protein
VACPDDLWPVVDVAERRLRVVMEVTERAVARDRPACSARSRGLGRSGGCRRGSRRQPPSGSGCADAGAPGLVVRAAQPLLDKLAPAS